MPDSEAIIAEPPVKPAARPAGPMRAILLALVALGVVGGAYALFDWWTTGRFVETTNNAYLRADAVTIAPKISGYITAVDVGDNQDVAAGVLLARIEQTPYQAAYDLATADIAQRQADLDRFRAELAAQEAALGEAAAKIDSTAAAATFATLDAERYDRLAASGSGSTQRREMTAAQRDQSKGEAKAARAAANTAARQLDVLRAQIAQGNAALASAEAQQRAARSNLDGTTLAAPVAGRVGNRTVRVGQYVQAGTRLMTVVPLQEMYLIANFKETQLKRMRPGQPVRVTVDALSGHAIKGTVDSFAPGTGAEFALLPPENATGNFTKIVQRVPVRVKLQIDPALRDQLRPGLSAEVEVTTR